MGAACLRHMAYMSPPIGVTSGTLEVQRPDVADFSRFSRPCTRLSMQHLLPPTELEEMPGCNSSLTYADMRAALSGMPEFVESQLALQQSWVPCFHGFPLCQRQDPTIGGTAIGGLRTVRDEGSQRSQPANGQGPKPLTMTLGGYRPWPINQLFSG